MFLLCFCCVSVVLLLCFRCVSVVFLQYFSHVSVVFLLGSCYFCAGCQACLSEVHLMLTRSIGELSVCRLNMAASETDFCRLIITYVLQAYTRFAILQADAIHGMSVG